MSFIVPILLIAWRRPVELKRVINCLRPSAPENIYVACDGPRLNHPNEILLVKETRAIISSTIDWTINVHYLFQEQNLGCRDGVSTAITWFFAHEPEGIILEDDCVPCKEFLIFCQTLLARYRVDSRVWCISGSNFQNGHWRGDCDYYFSRYNHCWGWASWRRCWDHYDLSPRTWNLILRNNLLSSLFSDKIEHFYWQQIFAMLFSQNKPNTWDYQWYLTCLANNGLTATPNFNLIENIGFDDNATHTRTRPKYINNVHLNSFDLNKIPLVIRNANADWYTFVHHFVGSYRKILFLVIRYIYCFLKPKKN